MRPLTLDDLDWVVEVTRRRREALAAYAPLFWRPASDATERHRAFLAHLVAGPGSFGLRTEHGYALVVERGDHRLVDDMVVSPDERWADEGVALLGAVLAVPGRVRFVAPVAEPARTAAARSLGLDVAETWWHRDLPDATPVSGAAAEIDVPGATGRLVPAPPVYDPGGPVLLVTRVESPPALAAVEAEAGARGATVSVVSQAPGDGDTAAIARSAGYVETTFFMER